MKMKRMNQPSEDDDVYDLPVFESEFEYDGMESDGSTHSTSAGKSTSSKSSDDDQKYFATKESVNVHRLKVMVILILMCVTVAVCLSVYYITSKGQQSEFEGAFDGSANKVLVSFQAILEQKIAAIASLGVTFTAYAQSHNETTWPFITLNDFQQRAASARSLSSAYFLELLPIVTDENREAWEHYSVANKGWLSEGRRHQERHDLGAVPSHSDEGAGGQRRHRNLNLNEGQSVTGEVVLSFTEGESSISDKIFSFDENFATVSDPGPGPYYPIWQSSPVLPEPRDLVNYNLVTYGGYGPYIELAANSGQIAIGGIDVADEGGITYSDLTTSFFAYILSFAAGKYVDYTGDPMSSVYVPVVDSFEDDRKTVAVLVAIINWATYFENTLPKNSEPVIVVLENSCDGQFSYEVSGEGVTYLGPGSTYHDAKYEKNMKQVASLDKNFVAEETTIALTLNQDRCQYLVSVYPSVEMDEYYNTYFPIYITVVIGAVFLFTASAFLVYDRMVEQRQNKVLDTAKRSTAIVESIFPKNVVGRLMTEPVQGNATKLRSFLTSSSGDNKPESGALVAKNSSASGGPIADLFPAATVMFGDVEGFTAWSSVREPSQVFMLLESLYRVYDELAKRRKVYKVETVGDCYVAVAGCPDPREDHAIVMARFARECIAEHLRVTKELEVTLGPDTGDLRIRIGLHSGPITAGVLRGERSRFQLFGDTVNTAARLESTGDGNQIHISSATAELLTKFGKGHWIKERQDNVHLKGKGELKTYWLSTAIKHKSTNKESSDSSNCSDSDEMVNQKNQLNMSVDLDAKTMRTVEWNVDVLVCVIKQIVARRNAVSSPRGGNKKPKSTANLFDNDTNSLVPQWKPSGSMNPLDEVVEIIHLPELSTNNDMEEDPTAIQLDPKVVGLVRDYVTCLAKMYRSSNPFHNFEHASHVTMSVGKLLSRIVAPSDMDYTNKEQARSKLHDHTYGITSDPLTQFACILSSLIHDVDHQGVSNFQLIKEDDPLVDMYNGKSVAEQNSVDLAWNLLMEDQFAPLRATICSNTVELARLRQLVVNGVLATDIFDKELKQLRNERWEKAFSSEYQESERDLKNRKATIVIEHLIQASDVAHTMQHWNVYRKWNTRLFQEMYKAYKEGRSDTDPSEGWYKGEIGFFDFYIIPLAKKLKDCGVFGVSSDEYLQYAIQNRNEWERKGESIVEELIESVSD